MKKLLKFSIIFFTIIIFTSCAKIFYAVDAFSLAHEHKIIAIMPPTVSIAASKHIDSESTKEQQKTESINFQQEMYSWMLKRKMQGTITQEILDIETTNLKLKKAGYLDSLFTPDKLCDILGVDGIISSNYSLSKPISDGGAVALALIGGIYGATNEIHVSMNIHDGKNKKLIWNYDQKFSGSLGSTPARLVDALMRRASKKMPYMN